MLNGKASTLPNLDTADNVEAFVGSSRAHHAVKAVAMAVLQHRETGDEMLGRLS